MRGKCCPPKKHKRRAGYIFSFAGGIIIATFLPSNGIMFVLVIILILLGIAYCK